MLDSRKNNSIPHVTNPLTNIKRASSAVRKLSNTQRDSGCPTLLQLHNALVVNHNSYAAPYLSASKSQRLHRERVYRAGLKTALGVPRQRMSNEGAEVGNEGALQGSVLRPHLGNL